MINLIGPLLISVSGMCLSAPNWLRTNQSTSLSRVKLVRKWRWRRWNIVCCQWMNDAWLFSKILAPIPSPQNPVICMGGNYEAHTAEAKVWLQFFAHQRKGLRNRELRLTLLLRLTGATAQFSRMYVAEQSLRGCKPRWANSDSKACIWQLSRLWGEIPYCPFAGVYFIDFQL